MSQQKSIHVTIAGEYIDTVNVSSIGSLNDHRLSLINHDGYNPNIRVRWTRPEDSGAKLSKRYDNRGNRKVKP